MQIYIYENFFILSEILIISLFLYILSIQLISNGVLKVKTNAYTFTHSIGLLTVISLSIHFVLINLKLNLSYSLFNFCLELTSTTNFLIYILLLVTTICLVFISKLNFTTFQHSLKFELYYLFILCLTGGLFIMITNDLLFLFLALELYNFGLYSLIGLQQNRVINSEISVKYYLVSALSSSFILFGISLLYGFTGLLNFNELNVFLINSAQFNFTLILGFSFVLIGLLIKLGAAPFHFWTPDIYEGATNFVNLILLTLPKIILICLLVKLVCFTFLAFSSITTIVIYILILCAFYFGTFGAIHQIKVKKFLTYSGISNFGLCLLPF